MQGDELRDNERYAEAKKKYEEALMLTPDDKLIQARITSVDEAIAEAERQRREAEEKARIEAELAKERARKEAEKRRVMQFVDTRANMAEEYKSEWKLSDAAEMLQQAIDSVEAHKYDYRHSELTAKLGHILRMQATLADTSKVFDYKVYAPALYAKTESAIKQDIRTYVLDRDKRFERNNLSFSLYTGTDLLGAFQLGESSRALKKFCKEVLNTEKLTPIVIDGNQIKAQAQFDYTVEYVGGKVKVRRRKYELPKIDIKFDISDNLSYDLEGALAKGLESLPVSCDGDYKLRVKSLDINGQTEHNIEVQSARFVNGPQNVWKSLLVPGCGDKYVDGEFKGWKALVAYGLIAVGVPCLFVEDQMSTTMTGYHYDYENYLPVYEYDTTYSNPARVFGILAVSCGAAVWVTDVVHVFVKGRNNKRENKERLGRLSFAYDPRHDATELVYMLRF